MPVLLIAFLMIFAVAAMLPNPKEDIAADMWAQGAAAAGQLKTWHVAAVRACYAGGTICGPGPLQYAQVVSMLPPTANSSGKAWQNGRFRSYFDGTYIVTVYGGAPAIQAARVASNTSSAVVGLVSGSTGDASPYVGYWNQNTGQFVGGGYTVYYGTQGKARPPVQLATQPAAYVGAVPNGSAMIVSKLR